MLILLHGLQHLFHSVLVLCFLVFSLPHLPETAFSDDIQVAKDRFLNFRDLYRLMVLVLKQFVLFLQQLLAVLFGLWFLLLVGEVLGVLRLEPGLLLGLDHEVIGELMVDIVEVDIRQIVFAAFFIELVEGALLTGNGALLVFSGFLVLETVFGLLDRFVLWRVVMSDDFFVDEGVDVVGLLGGLNSPRLLLLVEVY